MRTYHAAVWLDHNEARIFHVEKGRFEEESIVPERPQRKLHRRAGPASVSGRRAVADTEYLHAIAKALEESQEILLMGPSTAKLELVKFVHTHYPSLVPRILGVETVDHPSDRQIVAYSRAYFELDVAAE